MKIAVCLSHVPDTTTRIRFVDNNRRLDTNGVQWIINPWDELALTRALEIKESSGGRVEKVTVVHVGRAGADPTLRKAMAIGADNAIRVDADPADAFSVASHLAAALRQESFDLILCGIESSDYNNSAVGGMLAELLSVTSVSAVSGLEPADDGWLLHRDIDGGVEKIVASSPLVAIVQKGIAREPRIPSMRGIMMAKQKPLQVVPGVEVNPLTEYLGFEIPAPKPPCRKLDPEQVKELAGLLHKEAKVI
ncbi:MAG TPA: electron transfer flavoprotein beta subunit/FixA family protein [Bacteroidetes bacterium]|nr:electron transfer flavoprotein beta subunit/FixA family protein [Bacteroidota bacterium]